MVHEKVTLGCADRCGSEGALLSGQKASGSGQNPTAKPFCAERGTWIRRLHECQATLEGARMGLGVWGRELPLLPPPLLSREGAAAVGDEGGSLLKVRPFTLVSASRSSRGTVSALRKDDSWIWFWIQFLFR